MEVDTPTVWPPAEADPQDVSNLADITDYILGDALGEVPRDRLEGLAADLIANGTDDAQATIDLYFGDL